MIYLPLPLLLPAATCLPNVSAIDYPYMHPNLIHPNQSLPLSHSYPPPPTAPVHQASKRRPEDDEEIVAKKKKNADAQAAFRLRRQTYIKVRA